MITTANNDDFRYGYFDHLRASLAQDALLSTSSHHVERSSGSSVIRVKTKNELVGKDDSKTSTHRLMHLVTALPLSTESTIDFFGLDHVKSVLLAQHHFNNRIESVVPNLQQLLTYEDGSECDLRMSMDFIDTKSNAQVTAVALTEAVYPRQFPYETTAVVGAVRSAVSIPIAVLNSVHQIPQISHASTSTALDQRAPFTSFGRVVPSNRGDAVVAMEYFVKIAKTTHLGIMYVDDEYGTSYRIELQQAALKAGVTTEAVAISQAQTLTDDAKASILRGAQFLANSGYCHFFGIFQNHVLEHLLEIGVELGIMGQGKFWLFGDAIFSGDVDKLKFPERSPKAVALHGSGILVIGASRADGSYARFLQQFQKQEENSQFFEYLTTISPLGTDAVQYDASLTTQFPTDFSELAYDAAMSLGIAACRSNNKFFTGQELFQMFMKSNFTGASGRVLVNEANAGRIHNTVTYVIHNIQVEHEEEDGMVGAKIVLASEYLRKGTNTEGQLVAGWVSPSGIMYNYSDFTTKPPPSLPPLEVQGVLDLTSVWICNFLAFLVILSATGFAIWTVYNRNSYVIRASQPSFLLVICFGEFLIALAVVMLGATSPPYSDTWASFSCMPAIWSFVFGFSLVFSALFAKTWRINKILGSATQFQRVTVTLKDAAIPGCFMVLGSLLVTAAWQVTDPMKYKLEFDEYGGTIDRFGRPLEIISTCSDENGNGIFFASLLVLIMITTVLAANFQAYHARHYATEFSESVYIGWSMAISLQGIILAIPVLFFDTDPNSSFLSESAVLLLLSSSTLYLIFIPKVFHQIHHAKQQKAKAKRLANRKKSKQPTQEDSGNNSSLQIIEASEGGQFLNEDIENTADEAVNDDIHGSLLIAPKHHEEDLRMHFARGKSGRVFSSRRRLLVIPDDDDSESKSSRDGDSENDEVNDRPVSNGLHRGQQSVSNGLHCMKLKQNTQSTLSVTPDGIDDGGGQTTELHNQEVITESGMLGVKHNNEHDELEQPGTIEADNEKSAEMECSLSQPSSQLLLNAPLDGEMQQRSGQEQEAETFISGEALSPVPFAQDDPAEEALNNGDS